MGRSFRFRRLCRRLKLARAFLIFSAGRKFSAISCCEIAGINFIFVRCLQNIFMREKNQFAPVTK